VAAQLRREPVRPVQGMPRRVAGIRCDRDSSSPAVLRTTIDTVKMADEVWDGLEQGLTQGFVEYHGEFVDVATHGIADASIRAFLA
jgi:hypothetical protein